MDTVFSSLRFRILCSVLMTAVACATPVGAQETAGQATEANESHTLPMSQEALDSLLAPIALYPDALLAQVLMAATYPMDVIEAARWQQAHPDLNGQALQEALAEYDWDSSVKSLVTVPQVLQYMNDAPRWMQDLGGAVLADQPRVMASVQTLRQKAQSAGALASNDKQVVKTTAEDNSDIRYITIAPASTQVVYVPVYDPYVVYGGWWWPTRPVYWGPPPGAVFSSGYFWGGRYYSSVALWGGFSWGGGVITVNAPLYSSYYRRPPPVMGRNVWWRPPPMYAPPVGGHGRYYNTRPRDRGPYERYVNRPAPPASPPSYAPGPGRDPRPGINRPGTTSPSAPPGREPPRLTTKPAPQAATDGGDDSRRASGRMVQGGNPQEPSSSTRQVRQPSVERNDRSNDRGDRSSGFSSSGQELRQGGGGTSRERR